MVFTTWLEITPLLRGLNQFNRFNPALPRFRPGNEAPKDFFTAGLGSRRLVHFGDAHGTPRYLPNLLPRLSFRGRRHPWRPKGDLSRGLSSRKPKASVGSRIRPSLRPPRLAIKISTPNVDVDGLENLKVTVTVTNVGDETVKLLNEPGGVFSSLPTDIFDITNSAGFRPSFVGVMCKYSPEYAAGLDDPEATIILAPGASISVTHDLSAAYDFRRSGPGEYYIEPSNAFMYIDADGKPQDVYAPGDTVKVRLSGKLSVPRAQRGRVIPVIRSSIRQSRTNAPPTGTQFSAGRPRSSPQDIPGGTRRYSTWFGAYTASQKSIVQEHARLISSHNLSSFVHGSPPAPLPTPTHASIPRHLEGCTRVMPSGIPPTPIPVPKPELSFANLPALSKAVAPTVKGTESLVVSIQPRAVKMPTATSAPLRPL